MLLPHLLLIGSAGWLAVVAARHKVDSIAWAATTILVVGGSYWAVAWGPNAILFAPGPRVILQGISFVKVPAGREMIGSPKNEYGHRERDEDQREVVHTQDLCFSETEITQEQFAGVLGPAQNPSSRKGAKMPVHDVTLRVVKRLCEELGMRERSWHFRLPTEDEWECACRAGESGPICTGTRGNPSDAADLERLNHDLKKTAVYDTSSPIEVGRRAPNRLGLYDMQGNVAEMCCEQADVWNMTRVSVRGGSWAGTYASIRCASRSWIGSDEAKASVGIRLVALPAKRASRTAAGGVALGSVTKSTAEPRWAFYVDWTCRALGLVFLLMGMIRLHVRRSEDSFVAIGFLETEKAQKSAGVRLALLWIVIWTVASAGTVTRPYLTTRLKIPFLAQIAPVQEHVFAGLSILLGLLLILVGRWVFYPTSGHRSHRSRSQALVTELGTALVLYLVLRPVVDLLTWVNQDLVLRYLPNYRPYLAEGLGLLGNLPGTTGNAPTQGTAFLGEYGMPAIVYTVLCLGVVFEEFFFRGLLQGHFRLVTGGWRWSAILLPNLLYAAIILSTMPDQAAPMFLIGLTAGYATEWRYYRDRAGASLFCAIVLRLLLCTRGFLWLRLGVPYTHI
jgi:membrane protease YdiL (CAAX protease family)